MCKHDDDNNNLLALVDVCSPVHLTVLAHALTLYAFSITCILKEKNVFFRIDKGLKCLRKERIQVDNADRLLAKVASACIPLL